MANRIEPSAAAQPRARYANIGIGAPTAHVDARATRANRRADSPAREIDAHAGEKPDGAMKPEAQESLSSIDNHERRRPPGRHLQQRAAPVSG